MKLIPREEAHQILDAFYDAPNFHGDITFSFQKSIAYSCAVKPTAKSKIEAITAVDLIEKYHKGGLPEGRPNAPKDS
jgi:hypothetical protein